MRMHLVLFSLLAAMPGRAQSVPLDGFPRYELEVRLDPEQRMLEGRTTLWLPATEAARETIKLGLGKNLRNLTVEVVEPAESAGALTLEAQTPTSTNAIWNGRPVRPFAAGRPVLLRLSWEGGEETSFVSHLGPDGCFLSATNTAWYPLLEAGLGTGSLRIDVPAGWIVHATGLQRGSDEERARGTFRRDCTVPCMFALAAARYTVTRHEGAVPVSVLLLRPRPHVDRYVEGCRKCIEVLGQEFGPYPSGEFAIVEVPEAPAKAAGFTGASVAGFILVTSPFVNQRFNTAYYGHEIAHQWWGNLIRREGNRGRMMLDEAMAQYGSLRVVETQEGAEAAERYRRTGYRGYYSEQSGFGYLQALAAGEDHPLADLPDQANRALADGKGFLVWDLLARTVGRERFRGILCEFTGAHAFERVYWEQFLQAIERGAERDLRWFWRQWFERTGVPEWQLQWRQEGEVVHGTITQAEPHYRADLEVEATGADDKRHVQTVTVDGAATDFAMAVKFHAQSVVIDPRFLVPRWTPEYRAAIATANAAPLSPAEQELMAEEERLVAAIQRDDREAASAMLAEDFRQTGMLDWQRPLDREQWIGNAVRLLAALQAPEFHFTRTAVHLRPPNATVQTLFVIRQTVEGKVSESSYALLDFWSKDSGGWLLCARHVEKTPVK